MKKNVQNALNFMEVSRVLIVVKNHSGTQKMWDMIEEDNFLLVIPVIEKAKNMKRFCSTRVCFCSSHPI